MHACVNSIANLREQASQQLRRNASWLPDDLARWLLSSRLVECAVPHLIALNVAEIRPGCNLEMSPYYSGTDIHSAIAQDPIVDGGHCSTTLAQVIRQCVVPNGDVVLPCACASPTDLWLASVPHEWASFNNAVFFMCRYSPTAAPWIESFDDIRRSASVAGSFDVGICSRRCPAVGAEWTAEMVREMIEYAVCVFTAALDGEGYVFWKA